MTLQKAFTETEMRVRRHVAYFYLLKECLRFDESSGLYPCPTRLEKLIVIPMMEEIFDYDLRFVPGFFYDTRRNVVGELARMCGIEDHEGSQSGGWMLNTPEKGFIKPILDARGRIDSLHILRSRADVRPRLLTSKGLVLGT